MTLTRRRRGAPLRQARRGGTSPRRGFGARFRRELGCKAGHAGNASTPFRHRAPADRASSGRRGLQRFLVGLPKTYLATGPAWVALEHRRPRRRADRDGTASPPLWSFPPAPCASGCRWTSAVRVGGRAPLPQRPTEGKPCRRRLRERRGPPGPSCSPPRASTPPTRSSAPPETYVRTLIEDARDAYCSELRRTAIGPVSECRTAGERIRGRAPRRAGSGRRRGRTVIEVTAIGGRRSRAPRARLRSATFDGVHLGHRGGDRGTPTRCSPSRPHPAAGPATRRALPKLIMPFFRSSADVIDGLGGARAGRDRVRPRVRPAQPRRSSSSRVLVEAARRRGRSRSAPTFRFGAKSPGRPGDARRPSGVRDARVRAPWSKSTARPSPRTRVRGAGRCRRRGPERAAAAWGAPFMVEGTSGQRRPAGDANLGFPTANIVSRRPPRNPRPRGPMRRSPRRSRRPSTSVSGPPFETGRGVLIGDLPDRLRGRPLRKKTLRVAFVERLAAASAPTATSRSWVAQMQRDVRGRQGGSAAASTGGSLKSPDREARCMFLFCGNWVRCPEVAQLCGRSVGNWGRRRRRDLHEVAGGDGGRRDQARSPPPVGPVRLYEAWPSP